MLKTLFGFGNTINALFSSGDKLCFHVLYKSTRASQPNLLNNFKILCDQDSN
jgi:hypothetical protein